MSKRTDMYIHGNNGRHVNITSKPYASVWDYKASAYTQVPGIQFSNLPFKYSMEFHSLSTRYHAVNVKLLTAPSQQLVGAIIHLEGSVFEDMLNHGNLNYLGTGVTLEETLVFKHNGTIKLCRQ
jgi:hypothetical protein